MASLAREGAGQRHERRRECRIAGGASRYGAGAVLRPGLAVVLVNISSRAALVESGSRLRPGLHTELQICGGEARTRVRGRIDRCEVVRLDPLRYHGVIMFDESVDVGVMAGSE